MTAPIRRLRDRKGTETNVSPGSRDHWSQVLNVEPCPEFSEVAMGARAGERAEAPGLTELATVHKMRGWRVSTPRAPVLYPAERRSSTRRTSPRSLWRAGSALEDEDRVDERVVSAILETDRSGGRTQPLAA